MRIAYLSTFHPFRGGIAQFNNCLYRAICEKHTVKAYTFSRQYLEFLFPGKTQYTPKKESNISVSSIPILDSINPFSFFKTARRIRLFYPDILLMKYWTPFLAPALGTVAMLLKNRVKVISILGNVMPHEKYFFDKFLTKYFLYQNDGFIVMCESVKQELLKLSPKALFIKRLHPLYNHFGELIDKSIARSKFKIKNKQKVLLFFGFIRPYKGLDILLKAFKHLSKDYILLLAGECYDDFSQYQKLIEKSEKRENILVYDKYISDKEVPYFFSAADVCVLPYKSATQSGVTSIAYHFNLPVIATDRGGLREYILHQKTGLIIEQPTSRFLVESIRHYFDKNLKETLKKNILSLKETHSWENFGHSIIEFYQTL